MKKVKVFLSLLLCVLILIPAIAVAAVSEDSVPQIVINAEVLPAGHRMSEIILTFKTDLAEIDSAKLSMKTVSLFGREQNVSITSEVSGSCLTLHFSPISATTDFKISYDGSIVGTDGSVIADSPVYTKADVTELNTAVADDFIYGSYTGYYYDEDGMLQEMTIPYRMYIPENAEENVLPLVFTLHGSGEAGADNEVHIKSNQIAVCWADEEWQSENPCYVLSPQWPNADYSRDPYMIDVCIDLMHDLAKDVISKYNVDTQRVYAATLSMGSRMITRFMELYPEMFASALVCCGNADAADLSNLTQPAIWFMHAENDPVNKVQGSIDAYNTCVAAGNPHVKLTIFTREQMTGLSGHASWQLVYGNREFMDWLFTWKADGPSLNAPEAADVGEIFDINLNTDKNYTSVKLVNEKGKTISIKKAAFEKGEYINRWTISTTVGTAGQGRELTLLAREINGEYEEVGKITINVNSVTETTGPKAAVKSAVFARNSIKANTPVDVTVKANAIASQVRILNEKSANMGKKLVYVSRNGADIEFGYSMSVGTAGVRVFTFAAAKADGVYNYDDVALAVINVG